MHLWNCTHLRHPTDEQLPLEDILSNKTVPCVLFECFTYFEYINNVCGKGIVIFTRPLLVASIGAACVQYNLTNSTTSISGYCVRVLVNT